MIFSFERSDPARDRFLAALQEFDVNFEEMSRERSTIRVFGACEGGAGSRLQEIYESRRIAAPKQDRGAEIFARFQDPDQLEIVAGPCAVESESQIERVVAHLAERGVRTLRGGAFKPRTSPDSFQGLGERGLRIMADAARRAGMGVISEAMDRSQIDLVCEHVDVVQVGSRNMFNSSLLTALGSIDKPVLLKRGMAATIDEWLQAARYVTRGGNERVILCERGIRSFEPRTRFTLDVAAIALAKASSDLPVIADPSHAAGRSDLVIPLAKAAAAAGADGLLVEIHPEPAAALSDASQALGFDQFDELLTALAPRRASSD